MELNTSVKWRYVNLVRVDYASPFNDCSEYVQFINETERYILEGDRGMRILFTISIFISGLITAFAFFFAHRLTVPFDPTNDLLGGGNGNAALFFVMAPGPVIFYFYFSLIFVFEKLHKILSLTKQKWFKYSYLIVFIIIGVITFYRATIYRNYINTNHPYMEVGLLSQFSNNIFFNIWTFVALLSFIGFISFWTKKK